MGASIAICFGRVLRQLRKEAGWTQEQLGHEAELQRKYISSLELGQKEASLATVMKLAKALRISPGKVVDLVNGELTKVDSQ